MRICPALRRIGDDALICEYAGKSVSQDLYDVYCSENYMACPIYNNRTKCNVVLGKGVGRELENAIINAKERILISSPWIGRRYAEKLVEKASRGVKVFVITSGDEKNKESVEILRRVAERGQINEGAASRDIRPREGEAVARREVTAEKIDEEIADEEAVGETVELPARRIVLAAVISMLSFIAAYYLNSYPDLFYAMAALSAIAGFSAAYVVAKAVLYYDEKLARRIEVDDSKMYETDDKALAELVKDEEEKFGLMINDLVHVKLYIVDGRAWLGSANLTRTGMNENYEALVEIDAKTAETLFDELWKLASKK